MQILAAFELRLAAIARAVSGTRAAGRQRVLVALSDHQLRDLGLKRGVSDRALRG
jgi:uncharacterized protein YjiS (DUF1127 family)